MTKLRDQYPNIPRLPQEEEPTHSDEELLRLLEPYRHWVLLEIDAASSDILIGIRGTGKEKSKLIDLLLITGRAVNVWLHYRGQVK